MTTRTVPLTLLAWEGPQARAYLVRMRRSGLRPERVILMVGDPAAAKRGRPANPRPGGRAQRVQDKSHNFYPYAIRKDSPGLVEAIGASMAAIVDDPMAFYAEMYDDFSYADFTPEFERLGAN